MNTLLAIIKDISAALYTRYQNHLLCQQYAWWMVEAVTGNTKTELLTQTSYTLNDEQQYTLEQWTQRQIKEYIPLQYLLGYVPFINLEILVEPPILIPRPETEEWVINLIEKLNHLHNKKITILDLATGTGCIALALAQAFPWAMVWASDISPHAIELARKNAHHNNITNIHFVVSDCFNQLPPNLYFDIIVSNPPYISSDEWHTLDPAVTHWEDKKALIAENNGLSIIERIITQSRNYFAINNEFSTKNIPQLVIEIGYQQGNMVRQLMKQSGYTQVTVHTDLEKKDRVVSGGITHVVEKKHL